MWGNGWTSLLVPLWLAACLIWHLDGIISFSGESLLTQAHCILATHIWRKCTDMNQHHFPHERNFLNQYWCVNYVLRIFSLWINSWGTNDCFLVLALTPVLIYPSTFFTFSLNLIAHYGTDNMTSPNQISCIKIVSCFTFHWSLFAMYNSQSVSIGLGNGLMLHRRPARETSHYLSQLWQSLPTHIWVWWNCMVSYCR